MRQFFCWQVPATQMTCELTNTCVYLCMFFLSVEMLKVKAEGVARAEQERLNKDLRAEQLVLQAGETRKTVMDAIREAGKTVGEGFQNFVTDPQKVGVTVGIVTALAAGVYAARSGANVAGQYVASRLAQPPLVRETSRTNPVLHPYKALRNKLRKVRHLKWAKGEDGDEG